MNKRKCLFVFLFALCFSFFMIGCKKKSTTTKNNTTIKTTEKQNSSNNKTTNLTTNKKTVSSTTTKKTTAKQTTTKLNSKTTLIDIPNDESSLSITIKYSEDGVIKTFNESTYIENDTPIDISFSYIGDYLITITDGEIVNTYYLYYDDPTAFFGEDPIDINPKTFEINNYLPKTELVKIEYRYLEVYDINYDRQVSNVTMNFNGTDFSNSTIRMVKEEKKVNVKINNNSGNKVLFEVYKYDENDDPTIPLSSQIIDNNTTYEMPEFNMPTYDLYFVVTEYITYNIVFGDMLSSSDVNISFKSSYDDIEQAITTNSVVRKGTVLSYSITNSSSKKIIIKITDEWASNVLYSKVIDANSSFTAGETDCYTIEGNTRIYSDYYVLHDIELRNSFTGLRYYVTDSVDSYEDFDHKIKEGTLMITIINESDVEVMATLYDSNDNALDFTVSSPNDQGSIYIEEFNTDLYLNIVSYAEGVKFNLYVYDYSNNGVKLDFYDSYDQNVQYPLDYDFTWWQNVYLKSTNNTDKDYTIEMYDFKNELIYFGIAYAKENDEPGYGYLSFAVQSDINIYVREKENMAVRFDYTFGHYGEVVTIKDELGNDIEMVNKLALVEPNTKIIIHIVSAHSKLTVYGYDRFDNDVFEERHINKGGSTDIVLTVTTDIELSCDNS